MAELVIVFPPSRRSDAAAFSRRQVRAEGSPAAPPRAGCGSPSFACQRHEPSRATARMFVLMPPFFLARKYGGGIPSPPTIEPTMFTRR